MSDDVSFLEWGFKTVVGVSLAVGGWMWTMLVRSVGKNRDDLAAHRLHVSENYIKKDVIERIHDRLDKTAEKAELKELSEEMSEVRGGINKILTMMAQNGRA